MKYVIKEKNNNIDISVDNEKDNKEKLLKAFKECQEGRCSCPTEEYKKLDSFEIEDNDKTIQLHFKSKAGTKIDKEEINQCLEYTAKQISKKGTEGLKNEQQCMLVNK